MEARMPKIMIRKKEVLRITGESNSSMYRKIAEGKFPKPVPLGPRAVGWVEDEIYQLNEQRIAERDTAKAA
jgi:prophage regulatory protein